MTSSVRTVQRDTYETTDGQVFLDKEEAIAHQNHTDLVNFWSDHSFHNMDAYDITNICQEYRAELLKALGVEE